MIKNIKKFFSWILSFFRDDTFRLPSMPERKQVGGTPSKEEKKVIPRKQKPCLYCRGMMMVSVGQIAFTHRKCRTNFRSLLQRGR